MSWHRIRPSFEAAVGGFEVVERELELVCCGERVAVEAAGSDAFGRFWFVLVAGADEGRAFGAALDLLASVRSEADGVARGLARGARLEDVHVALVCERPSPELVRRMGAVDRLHGFEIVSWKRGGAEETKLVRRGAYEARTPEDFLGGLAEGARELAEDCLARIARLDPELEFDVGASAVVARSMQGVIARLHGRDALLEGATGAGAERVRIRTRADAEGWLAGVFHERFAQAEDDGLGALPADEAPPALPQGPLLSAEELAAFRD